jgi:hypothetical protein
MLWSEIMLMAALRNHGRILRETPNVVARAVGSGVRITAKNDRITPRSVTVSLRTWEQLARMSDAEFDGSCVLDLGIGTFQRGEAKENPSGVLTDRAD